MSLRSYALGPAPVAPLGGVGLVHEEDGDAFPQGSVFQLDFGLIGGHSVELAIGLPAAGGSLAPRGSMVLQIPYDYDGFQPFLP